MAAKLNIMPPVMEISDEKLAAAAEKLKELIDRGNFDSVTVGALRIALCALCSYIKIIGLLSVRGMGVKILRHILGIEVPVVNNTNNNKKKNKRTKKGRHNHGRRGARAFLKKALHRFFAHSSFNEPGCTCPECQKGGLFPHIGQWHRFLGQPLLRVIIINYEIWRCTLCGASFSAPIAPDIIDDGKERQPFGYSATALIVIAKFFMGTPWARQERLQSMLELPISASTLNDESSKFAVAIKPLYQHMIVQAAIAQLFLSDDTGVRILELKSEVKVQRNTNKQTLRTGVHTSAVLAVFEDGRRIAIFKSGIIHAGEFMDEILKFRDKDLPPPIHMADGSSCNPVTVCETIQGACNAHGRRKLEEKKGDYPEHWQVINDTYRKVYTNEAKTKELGLSPEERLAYHQKHSKQLMDNMFDFMQKELNDKNVEPNSILGGIFEYFLSRRNKLMIFTKYVGAPIDNNAVEQIIKFIALLRKNALFFKTQQGAVNADVILTVGVTAGLNGVNLKDYFESLLRYQNLVNLNPENFLPWTYQETVRKIEEEAKRKAIDTDGPAPCELSAKEWHDRQERIKQRRDELRKARYSKHTTTAPPHTQSSA